MPAKFSKKQIVIIGGGIVVLIVVVFLLYVGLRPKVNTGSGVALTVWGTEDSGTFGGLLASYPYGKVTYVQVDPANYHSQVLSALAAGTGPDVFEVSNRELSKWTSVLMPIPASSTQFGVLQLQNLFPDAVARDFVWSGGIYGLPLSIDTLAMVYNKDLFNAAGIAVPPATWDDFDADVVKLRSVNVSGQLVRAAAAIGGSRASIPNAVDILSLLMLQSGTQMTNNKGTAATFFDGGDNRTTGITAFNFYLQFANAVSPYYTWNDGMGNAVDSFVAGKTAIIFAYQSDLTTIEAKAPYLNIGIAQMPQANGASMPVNYPEYDGFAAAKAGKSADAWNLIFYLATNATNAAAYQSATGKPPALRALIQAESNNASLSVFATQILTAESWYEADDTQINAIFDTAIKNVLSGSADSSRALNQAQTAVSQLM